MITWKQSINKICLSGWLSLKFMINCLSQLEYHIQLWKEQFSLLFARGALNICSFGSKFKKYFVQLLKCIAYWITNLKLLSQEIKILKRKYSHDYGFEYICPLVKSMRPEPGSHTYPLGHSGYEMVGRLVLKGSCIILSHSAGEL